MTLHDRYPITSAATRLIRRPAVRALITLVWLLVALGGLLSLQTFLGELKVCRWYVGACQAGCCDWPQCDVLGYHSVLWWWGGVCG